MAFDVNIFTDSGLTLLSAVSATKQLVIDSVIPIEAMTTDYNLQVQSADYFEARRSADVAANVISVGVDPTSDTNSRIVVALSLAGGVTHDVTVRTVIVTAHTEEAGSIAETVTFIGSSDAAGIVVPYNATTTINVNLALSFAFNRASAVTVAGSIANYLLADEVARFVTTHALAGATQGDDQVIYGEKSFKHKVVIDGDGVDGGTLELWHSGDAYVRVTQANDWGVVVDAVNNDFTPETDANIYEFRAGGVDLLTIGVQDGAGYISGATGIATSHIYSDSLQSTTGSTITCASSITPAANGLSLGASGSSWGTCYANTIDTIRLKTSAPANKIALGSSLEPLAGAITIGTSVRRLNAVMSDAYYEGTAQGYLNKPFTTSSIAGGLVRADIGIGSIVPFVAAQGAIGGNKKAGDTFTLADSTAGLPEIFLSGKSLVIESGTRELPAGTYMALVDIRDTSPTAFGIAMRIA